MTLEITPLGDEVKKPVFGRDIEGAPHKAITAPDSTAWTTAAAPAGGGGNFLTSVNTTRLDVMDQRITDLENVLKKLGLLKG